MNDQLGFEVALDLPYDQAIEAVTAALKVEGFGVLTRIDVKATLKEKINVDFRPYAILGACNPPLAHRTLTADARVGLMLPCNVTVEEASLGGSLVRIANPEMLILTGDLGQNPELMEAARVVRQKLEKVAEALRS